MGTSFLYSFTTASFWLHDLALNVPNTAVRHNSSDAPHTLLWAWPLVWDDLEMEQRSFSSSTRTKSPRERLHRLHDMLCSIWQHPSTISKAEPQIDCVGWKVCPGRRHLRLVLIKMLRPIDSPFKSTYKCAPSCRLISRLFDFTAHMHAAVPSLTCVSNDTTLSCHTSMQSAIRATTIALY